MGPKLPQTAQLTAALPVATVRATALRIVVRAPLIVACARTVAMQAVTTARTAAPALKIAVPASIAEMAAATMERTVAHVLRTAEVVPGVVMATVTDLITPRIAHRIAVARVVMVPAMGLKAPPIV